MVVASHRHKDHISGFAGRSGETIRSLEPQLVIQPWTEDPEIAIEATAPPTPGPGNANLVRALSSMQDFSLSAQRQWMDLIGITDPLQRTDPEDLDAADFDDRLRNAERRSSRLLGVNMQRTLSRGVLRELVHVGITNIKNKKAVESLIAMAESAEAGGHYGKFGDRIDLADIMPGVKVRVLGPPTVDQWPSIRSQRHQDADEFWHLRSRFWAAHALTTELAAQGDLFPDAPTVDDVPYSARWVVPRAQQVRVDQLLGIVRALDSALNNTSLILVFEIGDKKLLFPGDAQIENWQYVLERASRDTNEGRDLAELLSTVDLYKVGHHGSLNATPKTLWGMFDKRSGAASTPDRMRSVVSTQGSVHGRRSQNTEVPRATLIRALKAQTHFHTTQSQRKKIEYVHEITMDV